MKQKEGFSKTATQFIVLGVIIVAGGLWYFTSGTPQPSLPAGQNPASQNQTATTTAITAWKTFTNPTFGFTFHYPLAWGAPIIMPLSTQSRISFLTNNDFTVEVGGYYSQQLDRMLTLPEAVAMFQSVATSSTKTNITLGGKPAVEIISTVPKGSEGTYNNLPLPPTDQEELDVVAEAGSSSTDIIHIAYAPATSRGSDAQTLLNQILATFKFSPQASVQPFKTVEQSYTLDFPMVRYPVSITYPASWVALPRAYQSAAQQANGETPQIFTVVFAPKSEVLADGSIKPGSNDYVQIGAIQEICSDFKYSPRPSNTFRCANAIKGLGFDLDPIFTSSINMDVLNFYADLLSQLRNGGWTVTSY